MLHPDHVHVQSPTFLWDLGPGPHGDLPGSLQQEQAVCIDTPDCCTHRKVESLEEGLVRQSRGYVSVVWRWVRERKTIYWNGNNYPIKLLANSNKSGVVSFLQLKAMERKKGNLTENFCPITDVPLYLLSGTKSNRTITLFKTKNSPARWNRCPVHTGQPGLWAQIQPITEIIISFLLLLLILLLNYKQRFISLVWSLIWTLQIKPLDFKKSDIYTKKKAVVWKRIKNLGSETVILEMLKERFLSMVMRPCSYLN